ncbi:MAG: FecR domain-containing protein, partial [Chloroflexi bacterium]|nr:FecR domain-containing protein [Chloroflexota bacterium]
MLPVLTPSPVSPAAAGQRPDEIPIALRLNQRLAAEVLQIAADHVVLALEGVPVVARLTSPDQAAMLAERRVAQFIVRGLSDQSLTLQLVHPETAPPPPPASSLAGLIPSLLEQAGLPVNPANTQIARALIERGLPVTPELVAELESALAGLVEHRRRVNEFVDTRPGAQAAPWNQADAQAAAALRAAGLPLSPGTLALARTQPAPLAETLARLQAQLESLSALPLPPRQAELARGALETLAKIRVDWSQPAPALAAQLREAVAILGRAVEHDLAKLLTAISDQSDRSADSALRLVNDLKGGAGRGFLLSRGMLRAEVAKQPPAAPLVFATPTADARVLGTELVLFAGADSTRLEVRTGRVRLTRREDGLSVDVAAGSTAVAPKTGTFVVKPGRAASGLQALYLFHEGQGNVIHDVAGAGLPLDLRLAKGRQPWSEPGLHLEGNPMVKSDAPATRIIDACRKSQEITLEAWVQPARAALDFEGAIVSLSTDVQDRNFALSQNTSAFDAALRLSTSDGGGRPVLSTAKGGVETKLTHLAFTRNAAWQERLYVNGVERAMRTRAGSFASWNDAFHLF